MTDDLRPRKRFRFQFRLVTLFWITLVVASFFAGQSTDNLWERLRQYFDARGTRQVTVRVGNSAVVKFASPVCRMQINNPRDCNATPLSPTVIQVTGLQVGGTQLIAWEEGLSDPKVFQVRVKR